VENCREKRSNASPAPTSPPPPPPRSMSTQNIMWNCYHRDSGRYDKTTTREGGTTQADGEAACGGSAFKMMGGVVGVTDCDVNTRIDGCSAPGNDAWSNYGKDNFKTPCDGHDFCYNGPTNNDPARKQCDDNFWNDMGDVCNSKPWYEIVHCLTIRSVWGDALNLYPIRGNFDSAFQNDQTWSTNHCPFKYG
jgi:Prokaryotic phospholipase A2